MKYKDLFLLRHGELINSSKNILNGQSDTDLTDKGLKDTIKWIDYFRDKDISLILSSDLKRTLVPAKIYGEKLRCNNIVLKELREINAGKWEGLTYSDLIKNDNEYLKKRYRDPVNTPFPDGESLRDLKKRVVKCTKKYIIDNANIILIGHSGVIRVLLLSFLDIPLKNFFKFQIDFASLTHLRIFDDGNIVLVFHNKTL